MVRQVLLDTNFIITCVKQKIDFFDEIPQMGLEIVIPEQVIAELERLSKRSKYAKLSLDILKNNDYLKENLGVNSVDKGLVKFARKNKDKIIATLDKEIKKKVRNNKLVIRRKKKLEVI